MRMASALAWGIDVAYGPNEGVNFTQKLPSDRHLNIYVGTPTPPHSSPSTLKGTRSSSFCLHPSLPGNAILELSDKNFTEHTLDLYPAERALYTRMLVCGGGWRQVRVEFYTM